MKPCISTCGPVAAALHDGVALALAFLGAMALLTPGGIPPPTWTRSSSPSWSRFRCRSR
jgi:hypothetical protein